MDCCDGKCKNLNQTCPSFEDEQIMSLHFFVLSFLTSLGQCVIIYQNRLVFFYRLTWTEKNEGFNYRLWYKYVEKFFFTISCGFIKRWKLRGKNIETIDYEIERFNMWICVIVGLFIEFLQCIHS